MRLEGNELGNVTEIRRDLRSQSIATLSENMKPITEILVVIVTFVAMAILMLALWSWAALTLFPTR